MCVFFFPVIMIFTMICLSVFLCIHFDKNLGFMTSLHFGGFLVFIFTCQIESLLIITTFDIFKILCLPALFMPSKLTSHISRLPALYSRVLTVLLRSSIAFFYFNNFHFYKLIYTSNDF